MMFGAIAFPYLYGGSSGGTTVYEYVEGGFQVVIAKDNFTVDNGLIVIDSEELCTEGLVVKDHDTDNGVIVNKLGGNLCAR